MKYFLSDYLARLRSEQNPRPVTLLAANQRQCRMLADVLFDTKLAAPRECRALDIEITTPSRWIAMLWRNEQANLNSECQARLLSAEQSLYLWQQALDELDATPPLIDAGDLARQLMKAEEIEQQYLLDGRGGTGGLEAEREARADLFDTSYRTNEEYVFYRRVRDYKNKRLDDLNVVTLEQACAKLTELPTTHPLTEYPKHANEPKQIPELALYGFIETPPAIQALITAFSGGNYFSLEYEACRSEKKLISLAYEDDELAFAAHWAKDTMQKHPGQSIAVVVPDLHQVRTQITEIFAKTLEEARFSQLAPLAPQQFDVSVGETLSDIRLVQDALSLMELCNKKISLKTATTLCASPYWGGESLEQRAKAKVRLKNIATLDIYVSDFIAMFDAAEADTDADDLKSYLHQIAQTHRPAAGKTTMQERVAWFVHALASCGWPGARALVSTEYQHTQAFIKAMHSLHQFDAISASGFSFSAFKQILINVCQQHSAQLEVKNAKVRILGLMEAAGQHFDHCLIIGANQHKIPDTAKPSPFLPLHLQRLHNTPRSSIEREQGYAQRLLENICSLCHHVSFSFAQANDDGQYRPASILKQFFTDAQIDNHLSASSNPSTSPSTSPSNASNCSSGFNEAIAARMGFSDYQVIKLGDANVLEDGAVLKGGVGRLNLQRQNPLFAFFKYQLGVDISRQAILGVDALGRGVLVHAVLELIYEHYPSQQQLVSAMDADELQQTLDHAIQVAWRRHWKTLGRQALLIEQQEKRYIADLVLQFLHLDVSRAEAFDVLAQEHDCELDIAGLRLHTRIDRVDKTASGACVVIDYKTGTRSLAAIVKTDTEDFQLPVYALAPDINNISSVTYANIGAEKCEYRGIGDGSVRIQGVQLAHKVRDSQLPESWPATLAHWQNNLYDIVNEIKLGFAVYQDRMGPRTSVFDDYELAVRPEERANNDD